MESRSITKLDFSANAYVFLKFNRIHNVDELTSKSRKELAESSTKPPAELLDHIEEVLAQNNLQLRSS